MRHGVGALLVTVGALAPGAPATAGPPLLAAALQQGIVGVGLDGAVTPLGFPHGGEPAWSPDASRFAFVLQDSGGRLQPGIWIAAADGSGARALGALGVTPTWSPDGT